MSTEEFLAMCLALTLTLGYLGLVALFCFLVPRGSTLIPRPPRRALLVTTSNCRLVSSRMAR
jgi:hypothetical protein